MPDTPDLPETAAPRRALPKGQQTRAAIVEMALALAATDGLEGLSIGLLAERMQMSKSGVFAHFGSREELQLSVIREYHAQFEREVFEPAMQVARGLPRLAALYARWLQRLSIEIASGCLYIGGAVEFDDRPGPVRDALVATVRVWQTALHRAITTAVTEGHLDADTDAEQLLFELHGLVLALHHDARFLRKPGAMGRAQAGFDRLVARHATAVGRRAMGAARS